MLWVGIDDKDLCNVLQYSAMALQKSTTTVMLIL